MATNISAAPSSVSNGLNDVAALCCAERGGRFELAGIERAEARAHDFADEHHAVNASAATPAVSALRLLPAAGST